LVEHDSLKISNGKWFRHSTQQGGASALDFLIKIRGIHFVDAVETLAGKGMSIPIAHAKALPTAESPPKRKSLPLPKPNRNNDRVIAYLRGRGIGKEVINRCIKAGILYESDKHRCVFVGNDNGGTARYAFERGTADDWKKDVAGSNKTYGFSLPPEQPQSTDTQQTVAIFESPADLLAHHTIHAIGQTGWDGHRLSLGGVGNKALSGFLERNPQITCVHLCLDSDQPGRDATERTIRDLMSDRRHSGMKLIIAPAPIGKDYSDTLKAIRQTALKKPNINRHQAVH
jgi:hypothetical protein